jgi:serine/threonine-protein kinase PRP4
MVGELIKSRYKVKGIAGRGVFSCVVKATDTCHPQQIEVAIKIIRMFDIMRESGEKEREIVQMLNKADPGDKRNIVRLFDSFEYHNHLCLVYECLEMNLRETLHRYGRHVGLSLDGVCLYGRQLF